jgi:glutamyl-tRNA reductase
MVLMALGVSYQTAPLPLREKLARGSGRIEQLLRGLVEKETVQEALFLSTCNRTELYCAGKEALPIIEWLAKEVKLTSTEILPFSYTHIEVSAVQHLMRVASGLNSMVLGEVEILGQIKTAYRKACEGGMVGKRLGRLFQTSFSVAKQVRTETGISVNSVSIASTAVRLAERIFTDLKQATVLLIGAGELIRLIVIHLRQVGVSHIILANRSESRRDALSEEYGAESISLSMIPEKLKEADIVIAGTASILPIVGKGMVERALKYRKRKPIFMVDLAMPRDIEPEVGELDDVYLYGLHDLQTLVEENRQKRAQSILVAEHIIQTEAEQFMQWLRAQTAFGTVKKFREKFEIERDQVLTNALRQLQLGKSPEIVLQRAVHSITNRLLHAPTRRLRQAGYLGDEQILKLSRELFELNNETIDPS